MNYTKLWKLRSKYVYTLRDNSGAIVHFYVTNCKTYRKSVLSVNIRLVFLDRFVRTICLYDKYLASYSQKRKKNFK
jgi:hypothetical protein